jgi:NAD(P)-dependent dehydrogenase (short-subunit alcohol dehydrogenase family)
MSARTSKTLRTDPDEWRRVLGTNLDGVHYVVAELAPGMVERRDGRIVVVSACMGRMSGPGTSGGFAPYRVSKAAINAYAKNLAAEVGGGRRGVLVDAVCPAHCRTDMGGPDAPRSAEQGAATAVWLAARAVGDGVTTGMLWEDREPVDW